MNNTSRRDFLKVTSSAAIGFVAGTRASEAQDPVGTGRRRRPNILYVFSDEHRWCSLGHTEMPDLQTPNFTAFALQGASVENCVANNPVCVPYRGILQTGLYSQHNTAVGNGLFFNRDTIGIEHPSIAQAFSKAGYRTGYVGKWHLGDDTCAQAGYDFFHHWKHGDDHWNTKWRDVVADSEDWKVSTNYNPIGMTDHALKFIDQSREQAADDPWMLMLSWNPPHFRWDDAPEDIVAQYDDGRISVRPNAPDRMVNDSRYVHYHAHITAIDREFGRLLQELEDRGLEEDTIVIYSSDHGSGWHSNGFFSKPHPIDEVARVPFFIRWPGVIPEDRTIPEPISTVDFYPTFLGLAGIAPPPHCDGKDWSKLLTGQLPDNAPRPEGQLITIPCNPRRYVDLMRNKKTPDNRYACRGLRTSRYTFVVNGDGDWMLFDNENDPYQMTNLVDDPEHAELKEKLRGQLEKLVIASETKDPYLPDEIRELPLAEKIAATDEFYALKWKEEPLKRERDKALDPLLKSAATDADKQRLRTMADDLYLDREFRRQFLDYQIDLFSFWFLRDQDEYKARRQEYDRMLKEQRQKLEEVATENAGE